MARLTSLLPYQNAWVTDQSPIKVYEESRRIGITYAEAFDAASSAADPEGCDWWYIGFLKAFLVGCPVRDFGK